MKDNLTAVGAPALDAPPSSGDAWHLDRSVKLRLGLLSVMLSLLICSGTGVIPDLGYWYSPNSIHRWQADRMLHGQIALSTDPREMGWDLAWSNGTVQQVWGLAVPLWRLVFDGVARIFGQPCFPDRLAFAIALAGVIYILVTFCLRLYSDNKDPDFRWNWLGLLVTVLFPPFLALCGSRFMVYEEVAAYGFLASLLMMVWATSLWIRPEPAGFLALAFVSGLTPFIRPTLGVYGLASLVIGGVGLWKNGRRGLLLFSGGMLFATGIGLVICSNLWRFGSPMEFGFAQNGNNVSTMAFAARFGSPFGSEPILSAGRELFGLLFLTDALHPHNLYEESFFPGQSSTFRWRELYFNTYDLFCLGAILVAWGWLARTTYRRAKNGTGIARSLAEAAAWWSVLAALPLAVFYLRFPFIASRYLFDFAPAFSTACAVFIFLVLKWSSRARWMRYGSIALLLAWWGFELTAIRIQKEKRAFTQENLVASERATASKESFQPIPAFYTHAFPFEKVGIAYNGTGWDFNTGNTESCVTLYVSDPDCLILELAPPKRALPADADYECIRAKVDLEFLERESIVSTPEGKIITFKGPKKHTTGVQMVSLAMMRTGVLAADYSKFRLLKVSWHRHPATEKISANLHD